MKGSPIIATILVVIILLGIYIGTRSILLDGNDTAQSTDPHAGHNHPHGEAEPTETGHDDSSLETQFEISFSSKPKSIKITQPATQKEIINTTEIDDVEFLTTANISLEGHHVELAVEIQWENPGPMNFAEITISPENHLSKSATLKSDDDIDDIAEFHW